MAGASSGARRLQQSRKASSSNSPTREKAKKILKEGVARGKKLTDKQRRFFGHTTNRQS